jgi:hypothetical protein
MKKMIMIGFLFVILSGCATNNLTLKNVDTADSQDRKEVKIPIDPYQTLGLLETEAIKSGKVTVVKGTFSNIRWGEYFPGRISSKCWAVDDKGKEHFCQSVIYDLGFDGKLMEAVIVDTADPTNVIILSTIGQYAYDLDENEFEIEVAQFASNADDYRKKIILQKGTRTSTKPEMNNFLETTKKWNRYQTPEGVLLSPLGEKELKYIAEINPGYTFLERMIRDGKFSLVPDATGTIAGLAIDAIRAAGAPSTGWDFNSIITRRQMGMIIDYIEKLKKPLIEYLNKVNTMQVRVTGQE